MRSVYIIEGGMVSFGGRLFSRPDFRRYLQAMRISFAEEEVLREDDQGQLKQYSRFVLYTYLEG